MATAARERVEGHYEVRDTVCGTEYVWVPGEDRRPRDEGLHPWRAGYERWLRERSHPETDEWAEIVALN